MRKIPPKYENPIDDVLLDFTEKIQKYFYENHFTPNHITSLSLICCMFSVILIVNDYYILGGLLFFVSYFFDCVDGSLARTYKMTSKLGDYYDHFGDIFKFIMIMMALFFKNKEKFIKTLPFVVILMIFLLSQLGCQEIYFSNLKGGYSVDTLDGLTKMCPANKNNINDVIKYTRFLGCGTFNLFLAIMIITYSL